MKNVNRTMWRVIVCGVTLTIAGTLHAQTQYFDLNGDGFQEQIIASPNGIVESGVPVGVSTIEVFKGDTGERLVVFYGDGPNDFGAPVILDDISGDGLPDLIVPRPSHEEVVVFHSPWGEVSDGFVHIDRGRIITSPHIEVSNFSFEVQSLYDIEGDGTQDLQIGAHYLSDEGQLHTRVYIFEGRRHLLRAWVDSDNPSTTLPKFAGDTTGDATVTEADLDTALLNLGATSANRTMGDLNNDSIVDGVDLVEVLSNLNQQGYLPQTDPNSSCEASGRTYRTFSGSAGWSCVTLAAIDAFLLSPLTDESGLVTGFVIEDLPPSPNYMPNIPNGMTSCRDDIADCWEQSEALRIAYYEAMSACTGVFKRSIRVMCIDECPQDDGIFPPAGETDPYCVTYEDDIWGAKVTICKNSTDDICGTLAHEFTHIKQFCEILRTEQDCKRAISLWNLPENKLCREYDAHVASGICGPGLDISTCCNEVCRSVNYNEDWQNTDDFATCLQCCEFLQSADCCGANVWDITKCPDCEGHQDEH